VLLGLGLMGLGEQRFELGRWLALDLAWATVGGGVIGGLLGAGVGRLIVHLRSRHGQAVGQDMFLGLGLIGVSYGVAHLCLASGFLSVFAAGLALRRVSEQPRTSAQSLHPAPHPAGHSYITLATHSHHASLTMRSSVEAFNGQIEKIAEMALVLLVGAMLPYALLPLSAWWFIPLLLIVLRPVSVLISTAGERLNGAQCALVSWFGIRGIGSVFYVLFAVRHGMGGEEGQMVVSLTLWTVAASIVGHGVSAKPLMLRYLRGKPIAAMEE
jgi:NhaP-type Na+/H+ or K+/H+ antiporter